MSEEIYAYTGMSEKWGLSHMNQEKWGQSYTFVEKRGLIIYLAALIKREGVGGGGIRHAHPYYAIYRKLPPHLSPHPLPRRELSC